MTNLPAGIEWPRPAGEWGALARDHDEVAGIIERRRKAVNARSYNTRVPRGGRIASPLSILWIRSWGLHVISPRA